MSRHLLGGTEENYKKPQDWDSKRAPAEYTSVALLLKVTFPVHYVMTSQIAVCAVSANGIKKSLTAVYMATFSRSRQANGLKENISRDVHWCVSCKFFPTTCNFRVSLPTFPQRTKPPLSCCICSPIQIQTCLLSTLIYCMLWNLLWTAYHWTGETSRLNG
jgi:hypothetical protein